MAGTDIYGNNAILAELLAGRRPEWFKQTAFTGRPNSVASGVPVTNQTGPAPVVHYRVDLRRNVQRHEGHFKLGTVDLLATTYTLTVAGTSFAYDASIELPADEAALLEGLRSGLATALGVSYVVETVDYGTTGAPDKRIRVYRTDGATFAIGFAVAGGSGTLSAEADAVSAEADVWVLDAGIGAAKVVRWARVPGMAGIAVDDGNIEDFFVPKAAQSVYIELRNVVPVGGHGAGVTAFSEVRIGPSVLESDPP